MIGYLVCLQLAVVLVQTSPLPQENIETLLEHAIEEQQQDLSQPIFEQAPRNGRARNFGNVANILAVAGAEPQKVDPSGGYSGRKRRQTFEDYDYEQTETANQEVQFEQAQAPRGGRDFGDIGSILAIAGAKPVEVDPSGSYSGRKRRQSVDDYDEYVYEQTEIADQEVEQAQASRGGRDFGDIGSILAIAGAKPQAVDLSGSYSGRKRRQTFEDYDYEQTESDNAEVIDQVVEQAARGGRDFGDIGSILAIAGAKPQVVDPSGGYSGRKRRQSIDDYDYEQTETVESDVATGAEAAELPRSGRNFGDIAHILAVAGAEPVEVDFSGSYTGRRKRSDTLPVDSLVKEVKLKAVKVNTHGKYGSLIHEAVDGATPSRTIFDEAIYG